MFRRFSGLRSEFVFELASNHFSVFERSRGSDVRFVLSRLRSISVFSMIIGAPKWVVFFTSRLRSASGFLGEFPVCPPLSLAKIRRLVYRN